ncbi:hypothetical protein TraAM80_07464 [Trypanosoma rangeli]|uniref:Transmembrane protein n=1 Tax=Trypanosoma rangeli TaxID=5698 RepID=A0A422N5G3_TRYRA|nr:uncharacterized protein TraAM80_07464 [Trypanosoma rangeli]RNF00690.1 hypothetical protein TraAM80_07464 [Trypanosoma rangeli]|eukprot:RNF00690.1 hypothetical protein TraAM80_07464 [Trypanosoma rangeli]
MSSLMDTSGHNTSSAFSDTMNEGQTGDGDRTYEQTSLITSHRTLSESELPAGSFLDEDQTHYDDDYATGYDSRTYNSRTYDTRTYDSQTYNDSSFPQSPRSDELSSTFASFYLESSAARKVRSVFSFLNRPLFFFSAVLTGSGGIGTMCRVVHAITVAATQRQVRHKPSLLHDLHGLPDGYPNVPEWMQQARLALPLVVEGLVKKALCACGVPALADLQKARWARALGSLESAKNEIISQTTHVISGPMVPLVIFLPLLSFFAISVARCSVARRQARLAEEEEFPPLSVDEAEKVSFLRSSEFPDVIVAEESSIFAEETLEHPVKVYTNGHAAEQAVPPAAVSVRPFLKKDTSGAQSPSEDPTSPNTVPTSRDLSPIPLVDEDALKSMQGFGVNGTRFSPPTERLHLQPFNVAPYALRGDIVAALMGTPTAREINVLLIAASRYNCRRVIVPAQVPASDLVSVPSSLSIERVDDVMQEVMSEEEPRGLTTVAVFLRPVTEDTVELSLFQHPSAAVYVFVAAHGVDEDVVSYLVDKRIYTAPSLDEPIPANACFYDRSVKERDGTIDIGSGGGGGRTGGGVS